MALDERIRRTLGARRGAWCVVRTQPQSPLHSDSPGSPRQRAEQEAAGGSAGRADPEGQASTVRPTEPQGPLQLEGLRFHLGNFQ